MKLFLLSLRAPPTRFSLRLILTTHNTLPLLEKRVITPSSPDNVGPPRIHLAVTRLGTRPCNQAVPSAMLPTFLQAHPPHHPCHLPLEIIQMVQMWQTVRVSRIDKIPTGHLQVLSLTVAVPHSFSLAPQNLIQLFIYHRQFVLYPQFPCLPRVLRPSRARNSSFSTLCFLHQTLPPRQHRYLLPANLSLEITHSFSPLQSLVDLYSPVSTRQSSFATLKSL
jgi:hypothetical protein